jgi:microcystin-dependent protein
MSATESKQFSNISATTAAFSLLGGKYGLDVSATFGGGNVQLQTLSLDGSTWVSVGSSITTAGLTTFDLPPGQYRLAVTTATAVYAALTTIIES